MSCENLASLEPERGAAAHLTATSISRFTWSKTGNVKWAKNSETANLRLHGFSEVLTNRSRKDLECNSPDPDGVVKSRRPCHPCENFLRPHDKERPASLTDPNVLSSADKRWEPMKQRNGGLVPAKLGPGEQRQAQVASPRRDFDHPRIAGVQGPRDANQAGRCQ